MQGQRLLHMVVVLNWHGRSDTLECVESLVVGSPEVSILVVDNGSFDGTLDEMASRWPSVATLQLDHNLGFSGGMNRGIEYALDQGADVVTVLNNDTIVPAGTMRILSDAANDTVAVSPEVMYRASPNEIWFGGGTLADDAFPHHTRPDDLEPCHGGLRFTRLLAGCCITATREVWQRAGLFDERFFLSFEDSEWSMRAMDRGIRLAVTCDARILHSVSASFIGAAATLGTFYYVRNGLLFNRTVDGSLASKFRFVRRATSGSLGDRTFPEVVRGLTVVAWAVAAHVVRRYGEAPMAMQRLAARWNARRHARSRSPER